jgi:hypothetical protein
MSGLYEQNENLCLEEQNFLLPWLCCPLLIWLKTNRQKNTHFHKRSVTKDVAEVKFQSLH